jgi:hypothetical protein
MFLVILFFLFLLVSPVQADGFDLIQNSSFNRFRQTTALTISSLPISVEDGEIGVVYDEKLIQGQKVEYALEFVELGSLADNEYWRRIPGVFDEVSGPPGTQVDVLYYFKNEAGHSVDVSKVALPFSRADISEGNWLEVSFLKSEPPSFMDISISWEQLVLSKKGLMKEYPGLGKVQDQVSGSLIIDSVVISEPILIEAIKMEEVGGELNVEIKLRNTQQEALENIFIDHCGYSTEFGLPSLEVSTIQYSLGDYDGCGQLKISNPNFKRECVIWGNPFSNWISTDAITVLAFREDGGWINGSYVQPEQESFCITRIPYSIQIQHNIYREDKIVVEVKEQISVGEVLGIEDIENNFVLPKTGVVIY